MKYELITFLLFITFLASCAPVTTPAPTATITATLVPTSTLAPTITPTTAPQRLSDAPDLPTWVEEYVHAYGGKVTVNGVEMDAQQLTDAIRQNPDEFIQFKQVEGIEYSLLMVENKILALQRKEGFWQASTMGLLGDILGIPIGSENRITGNFFSQLTAATVGGEWSYINPVEGVYNWGRFDDWVRELEEGGISADQITCQAGVSQYPSQWVIDKNPSPEELTKILETYVTEVIAHGKTLGLNTYVLLTEPYSRQVITSTGRIIFMKYWEINIMKLFFLQQERLTQTLI